MAKKITTFISLTFWMGPILVGCSTIQHADELLTLKRVSDEQTAMAKEVAAYDQRFEELVKAVKNEQMDKYRTKGKVRRAFGKPILTREEQRQEQVLEVWLYRYSTRFFDSDKVYLYFDQSGTLKEWEYKEAKKAAP